MGMEGDVDLEEKASSGSRRSTGEREVRYFAVDDVLCSRCGLRGHLSWACPEPEAEVRCFICGMPGHVSRDCQREVCYYCGEIGHKSRECPTRARESDPRYRNERRSRTPERKSSFVARTIPLRCYVCNGNDHLDCSLSRPYPARLSCYNCGEVGHSGLSCTLPGMHATLQAVTRIQRNDDYENGGRRKRRRGSGGGSGHDNTERQRELALQLYERIDEELGIKNRNRPYRSHHRDSRDYGENRHSRFYR